MVVESTLAWTITFFPFLDTPITCRAGSIMHIEEELIYIDVLFNYLYRNNV